MNATPSLKKQNFSNTNGSSNTNGHFFLNGSCGKPKVDTDADGSSSGVVKEQTQQSYLYANLFCIH